MADLSGFMDFMEDDDGFDSPLLPSRAHPSGYQYHVASPDAMIGLRLSALADLTLKQSKGIEVTENDVRRLRLNDNEEREFLGQVLGDDVVEHMVADGCKWEHVKRLGQYAFMYFGVSKDAADSAAESIFSGKAPTPTNRAAKRATTKSRATGSGSAGSRKATTSR